MYNEIMDSLVIVSEELTDNPNGNFTKFQGGLPPVEQCVLKLEVVIFYLGIKVNKRQGFMFQEMKRSRFYFRFIFELTQLFSKPPH